MRIFHFSDAHIDPSNHDNTVPALDCIVETVERECPDLVVFAGDLFDTRNRIDPTSLWYVRQAFGRMRNVCPIVAIPGNHDVANEFRTCDSVTAALRQSEGNGMYGVQVFREPDAKMIALPDGRKIVIAAMPAPSKYHYKAALVGREGCSLDEAICDVLRGLSVKCMDATWPTILVYHGAVKGGVFDNGRVAGAGMGVEIPRELFEGTWQAVLAGDLHSHQRVGRVVYSGAIAPLNYNLQGYQPVLLDWTIPENGSPATFKTIPIPVAHQLLTVEVGPEELATESPTEIVTEKLGALEKSGALNGSIVRVRLKIPEHCVGKWSEEWIRLEFKDVKEWKFQVERIPALRIRGEGVSVSTSIQTLMEQWIALNPELASISEELLNFARDIDAGLPPQVFLGTTGAHYRPLLATARNWFQYPEARLPFSQLGQLNCLNGPNMAGKSNAARIEPMALYGRAALNAGMTLGDVVRIGARDANVELEFETGSKGNGPEKWRIERTVKLSGNGASGGLNLMRWTMRSSTGGPGWVSANAADAPKTQIKINDMVGPPEMFFRTRFARQGDVDAILDMKPAELKDMITNALNAEIFEARRTAAKEKATVLSDRIKAFEAKLEGLRQTIEDKGVIAQQIEAAAESQAVYRDMVHQLQADFETLANKREETSKAVLAIEHKRERWNECQKRLGKLLGDRDRLDVELQKAKSLLEHEDLIREKTARMTALEEAVGQLDKQLLAVTQLKSDRNKVEAEIGQKIREREHLLEVLERELARLKLAAEIRTEVPCGAAGQFAGCRFLVDAVAAAAEMPRIEAELAAVPSESDTIALQLKQMRTIDDEIDRLAYDQAKHRDLKGELQGFIAHGWRGLAEKIAEVRGVVDQLEKRIAERWAEIDATTQEADSHQINEAEYAGLTAEVRDIETKQRQTKSELDTADAKERACGQEIARFRGLLEAVERAEQSIAELERQLTEKRSALAVCDAYMKAVSRDGIPFLLLERAIPSLQESVNDILSETPVSIEIEPLRELASGKVAEGVCIRYTDQNGTHPLPTASGFQRQVLGMALRAGVAELERIATGSRVELVYIDEGFGAFDAENLELAHDVLRRISKRFEKVIYITHLDQLKSIADVSIRVVPSDEGSRIEVS